jgi:hypothetical protein
VSITRFDFRGALLRPFLFHVGIGMKEYLVKVYVEGWFGSLLFGDAKVDPENFTEFLNEYAKQGWRVVTIEKEIRRLLLLSSREAYVVVFER